MLRQAAAIARIGFFAVDMRTNTIEACSERHAEIFGLTPKMYIQRATGLDGELSMVHPDDREALRAGYQQIAAGASVEIEYRFKRPGGTWGHIAEHIAPEFDAQGKVVRSLGSSRDVSDIREREAQTLQADRLETLGVLTGGVAHDFNNILAVILGNAQLGQTHATTPLMMELLQEIVEASQRGARLTKSLLAFAQRATMVPREIDLNSEIVATMALFKRQTKSEVVLTTDFSSHVPALFLDADQFQTVLLNLLMNAAEASASGGVVHVKTILRALKERTSSETADCLNVHWDTCDIIVRDEGRGIAQEIVHRVTEPFFTTKNRARGSGLGLSMAHGFVKQSGGTLEILSEECVGTTVTISFPLHHGLQETTPIQSRNDFAEQEERILLLEDDLAVAEVLRRQLETAGYAVMVAGNAEQLHRLLAMHDFSLAIFDNILPGPKNGVDIARDLRQWGLSVPIILLTGLPGHLSDQHLSHVDAVLHKPVPQQTLLEQIRTCLQQAD
ncbi:MAG: ATP-binding protein [Pseudomonadota bacterium]